jgi:ABC-type lipoprotein export system ATPase subunit
MISAINKDKMKNLFEIKNLRCSYDKQYKEGISKVVLEIDELNIPKGKKVFIVGESGIGKSTILETLGMMNDTIVPDKNTEFKFYLENNESIDLKNLWNKNNDKALSKFRLDHYSFIFQSTNLMRNFTAFENIAFTRMLQGHSKEESFERTRSILKDLGLEHVNETRMTQELSGGQQQRLAFARAVIPDFTVLFGDEPTGNLDGENAMRVMEVLSKKLDGTNSASAIIVSHDMHLAVSFADVIIKIRKAEREKKADSDEVVSYGIIDNTCIYTPVNGDNANWTNGVDTYDAMTFETFLRKK